jgi:tetratricopeptide (TPR) repeat protein/tRNA A-37 threonylcarbamoyl transferase component Bud32
MTDSFGTDSLLSALAATEPAALYLPAGTEIAGRYVVAERLGAGGMGVVYRARDPHLGRDVAIKVLLDDSEGGQQRLLREANAMAQLSHPNVVAAYDVGRWSHGVFVAMEFVEGRTLRAWLKERPRSWREVRDVFVGAGQGLRAMHEAGLVHRDFKPANVLIDERGRVRLADLGLVRAEGGGGDAAPGLLTVAGVGTPAYMAPEQHAGQPVDARSDQYAFCVALWEALSGALPFTGELAAAKDRGPPDPPAGLPAHLRRALVQGLQPDRQRRHASMAALVAVLERDPAALRRRVLALAGTALVAGASVFLGVRALEPSAACTGAEKKLAGVWDAPARERLREALRADATVFERVAARLDAYFGAWTAAHTEACEATVVRREQSEEVLDLRMACLDRLRLEAGAVVEVLASTPGGDALARGAEAPARLGAVAACADVGTLKARPPLPADAGLRQRIAKLEEELARANAMRLMGRFTAAVTSGRDLVAEARDIGHAPSLARALLLKGASEEDQADHGKAEATVREALLLAARSREDELAVDAWQALFLSVMGQNRFPEAVAIADAWDMAVQREGDGLRLSDVRFAQARLKDALGDTRAGVRLAEESAALRRQVLGERFGQRPETIWTIADWLFELGDADAAVDHLVRELASAEAAPGKVPQALIEARLYLGRQLGRMGRAAEARPVLERALELALKSAGAESNAWGNASLTLGIVDVMEERFAEGLAHIERAQAIHEKLYGADSVKCAWNLVNLAAALRGLGRLAEADAALARATAIVEKNLDPIHPFRAELALAVGDLRHEQRRRPEAEEMYRRAVALVEGNPDRRELLHRGLTGLGRVTCEAGRPLVGTPLADRALAYRRARAQELRPLAEALEAAGVCRRAARRRDEARALLEEALAIHERAPTPRRIAGARAALAEVDALLARRSR